MALFKRGGVWWYKFKFNGVTIRATTKTGNERTAGQIEAARKTQLAKGEVGLVETKTVPKFADFAPRFTAEIETVCKSKPMTVSFYKSKLGSILQFEPLASCKLNRIDEDLIARYIQARSSGQSSHGKIFAVATINRELATLRRCLRLAHDWKLISRVPRIRLLRGENSREFVLSHKQEPEYLGALNEPLRSMAAVMLDTGLRIGEAVSLDWAAVRLDPATGARYGYLTVTAGRSKSSKSRNIPLTARVSEVLKRLRGDSEAAGHVFTAADGGKLYQTWMNQQHRDACEAKGLPVEFVPHSLRHTFGTRLGESGADAFTIMKLMGHSSVTISQRYVHPSPESVERAFDRLEALNAAAGAAASKAKARKSAGGTNMGTPQKRSLKKAS